MVKGFFDGWKKLMSINEDSQGLNNVIERRYGQTLSIISLSWAHLDKKES